MRGSLAGQKLTLKASLKTPQFPRECLKKPTPSQLWENLVFLRLAPAILELPERPPFDFPPLSPPSTTDLRIWAKVLVRPARLRQASSSWGSSRHEVGQDHFGIRAKWSWPTLESEQSGPGPLLKLCTYKPPRLLEGPPSLCHERPQHEPHSC